MKNEEKKEIKYFSMFTGVGGFELGIGERGECIGFSEIDKYANELLKKRFPTIKNYGDATKIIPSELPDFNLLVGGFPCQAFSIAGRRKGFEDTRGTLFYEIARIIKVKRPSYLLLENVKGLLSHDRGRTFGTIISTLSELGYVVQWMVLNSKFFGVPQNRERVFIIGSLRGEPIPEILPFKNQIKRVDGSKSEREEYICPTISTKQDRGEPMLINAATKQGYSRAQVGDGIRLEYPKSETARGRVIKGKSNTLKSGTEGVIDRYKNIRKLTPLECERLQGFPDNWTEGFSDTQRYKMMGNAVTVNVIKALAEKLK